MFELTKWHKTHLRFFVCSGCVTILLIEMLKVKEHLDSLPVLFLQAITVALTGLQDITYRDMEFLSSYILGKNFIAVVDDVLVN